jgi:RNA polymerase sigma factor (sigma-70 family)
MTYVECHDWHLAEDIAQQVIETMAKRGHKMLTDTYGYHLKTMRWKLADHWRKKYATLVGDNEALDRAIEVAPPPWLDTDVNPELRRALRALPERQRQVVVGTFFEDKDDVEIARSMQISIDTLRNYRYLGIKRLKALLEQQTI